MSADNCVRFGKLILQTPADRHLSYYVKARERVNRYANGALSLFHGPRVGARLKVPSDAR